MGLNTFLGIDTQNSGSQPSSALSDPLTLENFSVERDIAYTFLREAGVSQQHLELILQTDSNSEPLELADLIEFLKKKYPEKSSLASSSKRRPGSQNSRDPRNKRHKLK